MQGVAKNLIAAEKSFFVILGENKYDFDEHLPDIFQQ
jgi:hypothetical protein